MTAEEQAIKSAETDAIIHRLLHPAEYCAAEYQRAIDRAIAALREREQLQREVERLTSYNDLVKDGIWEDAKKYAEKLGRPLTKANWSFLRGAISDEEPSLAIMQEQDKLITKLRSEVEQAREAVAAHHAEWARLIEECYDHWQCDEDHKVGKMLKALSGKMSGYRADIDSLHTIPAITAAKTPGE